MLAGESAGLRAAGIKAPLESTKNKKMFVSPDDEHGRRLLAPRIAARVVAGLESGKEFLGEIALCGLEGAPHRLGHLGARQDVALRGPGLALASARPVGRVGAGEGCDVALLVDDGHLAAVLAGEGVAGEELVDHLLSGESLTQQFEAARAVAHVDVGLGGDTPGAGLGPRHHGADGKIPGRDGDPAIAGGRIVGHNGERVDVGGGQRKRREEAGQDSVHRDCYITAARAGADREGLWGGPRSPGVPTGDDAPPSEGTSPANHRSPFGTQIGEIISITSMKLTAIYMKVPEGYVAFVEELPGANTQGATLDEARENLQEAVALVLDANRAMSEQSLEGTAVIRETFVLSAA